MPWKESQKTQSSGITTIGAGRAVASSLFDRYTKLQYIASLLGMLLNTVHQVGTRVLHDAAQKSLLSPAHKRLVSQPGTELILLCEMLS